MIKRFAKGIKYLSAKRLASSTRWEEKTDTAAPVRGGWADSRRRADIGLRKSSRLAKSRRAGSLTWFLRVISRLPKAGNNHHPWPGNRSGGCRLGRIAPWQRVGQARLSVGLDFRSLEVFGSPACKRPGAWPRLSLTPIKPSSPLSQDHQDLPQTSEVVKTSEVSPKVGNYAHAFPVPLVDKSVA